MTKIDKTTPMEELTIGGNIYDAGNAREFKTGDWRSVKPVWIVDYATLFVQIIAFLFAKVL